MAEPVHPSGRQLELVAGGARAVVVELGGGLRSYELDGRALLDGYGVEEMCSAGRGQTLIPWPNRIAEGRYRFAGRDHQLDLSEPERGTAIHGLVRWRNWQLERHEPRRVVLGQRLYPSPGYPFALELRLAYSLGEDGLRVETSATNIGAEACPFGMGAHPYLTVGTGTVDPVELRAPGTVALVADERGIPTGEEAAVAGSDVDFTSFRPIAESRLDTAFTALERAPDGRAWVELRAPGGRTAALWLDESYPYLMLFTGDALPEVNRRSLGVEPMSCPPNAFASGVGLRTLAPEETFRGAWGIASARSAG